MGHGPPTLGMEGGHLLQRPHRHARGNTRPSGALWPVGLTCDLTLTDMAPLNPGQGHRDWWQEGTDHLLPPCWPVGSGVQLPLQQGAWELGRGLPWPGCEPFGGQGRSGQKDTLPKGSSEWALQPPVHLGLRQAAEGTQ